MATVPVLVYSTYTVEAASASMGSGTITFAVKVVPLSLMVIIAGAIRVMVMGTTTELSAASSPMLSVNAVKMYSGSVGRVRVTP